MKEARLLRDNASARRLQEPGRCTAERSILYFAAMKKRQRIRPITMGSLLVPVFMICTTASLSHRQRTDLFSQCWPQTAVAKTIGSSSLTVMWNSLVESDHWN